MVGVSSDAFVAPSRPVVRDGLLQSLLPTLYGSRKTGVPHMAAAERGWDLRAGSTPLANLMGGVERSALVGRLSMRPPAASGDFSGVIKNSFRLRGGRDIVGASRERQDGTGTRLPWLRVANVLFS